MNEITTRSGGSATRRETTGGRIYGQLDLSCDCAEAATFTGLAERLPRGSVWVTSNLRRTHQTAAANQRCTRDTGP